MRREELYLHDIVEAAEAVQRFLSDLDEEQFLINEIVQSAILQKLTVIGEAAARIPHDMRENYPGIPWNDIVAFRNIAVHAYFAIDWNIVWTTALEDVPDLLPQIVNIIDQEFG